MFKAILYYLLMVAEFCITIFIGEFAIGLYLAFSSIFDNKNNFQPDEFANIEAPFEIGISAVTMFVLWFTFYRAKISRFTLGNIIPKRKWKAFVFFTLPILGFTLCYYGLLNLFGIDMTVHYSSKIPSGWLYDVPETLLGTFIFANIIFGAIFEELAKNGKKIWVIFLTIFIMTYVPICLATTYEAISLPVAILILEAIQIVYVFWVYMKTRSTILLFLMDLMIDLIPSYYSNNLVCIALCGIGGACLLGGYVYLQREYKDDLKLCDPTDLTKEMFLNKIN